MSGGNPKQDLIEHKNPELAMMLEHSPEGAELSRNHLEGRTAGFFCYGDAGGDELDPSGRPILLRRKAYFDPKEEPRNSRELYAPFVWQCRYGGVEVPDSLWRYLKFGDGKKYSDNQAEDLVTHPNVFAEFVSWTRAFAGFVAEKGKVKPSPYRAFRYKAPSHLWPDLKLKWRAYQMSQGRAPDESSPARQDALGLNQDTQVSPKKSEGKKLRRTKNPRRS